MASKDDGFTYITITPTNGREPYRVKYQVVSDVVPPLSDVSHEIHKILLDTQIAQSIDPIAAALKALITAHSNTTKDTKDDAYWNIIQKQYYSYINAIRMTLTALQKNTPNGNHSKIEILLATEHSFIYNGSKLKQDADLTAGIKELRAYLDRLATTKGGRPKPPTQAPPKSSAKTTKSGGRAPRVAAANGSSRASSKGTSRNSAKKM